MAKRQHAFIVRYWQMDHQAVRIDIEHVRTGARQLTYSLEDAVEWMRNFDCDDNQIDGVEEAAEEQKARKVEKFPKFSID